MTRINSGVEPWELCDQHLVAEYKEITRVQTLLCNKLKSQTPQEILSEIPKTFTLGTGHVKFFLDKQYYLYVRFHNLKAEMVRRGFNAKINYEIKISKEYLDHFWDGVSNFFNIDLAREKIIVRLLQRGPKKPTWQGEPINNWTKFVLQTGDWS